MSEYILVTDWEKVDKDDFYLEDEWLVKNMGKTKKEAKEIRQMAKDGELYEAYEVKATSYAIYTQMDAQKKLINKDWDVLVDCESEVIGNDHKDKIEAGE